MSRDTEQLAADLQRLTGCSGNHPVFAISEQQPCDCCHRIRATARLDGGGMSRLCRDCLWEPRSRSAGITVPQLCLLILALCVLVVLTVWAVWAVVSR